MPRCGLFAFLGILLTLWFSISTLYLHRVTFFIADDASLVGTQTNLISSLANFQNKTINTKSAVQSNRITIADISWARQKASVEYFACCGLGHRLSKMVDAFFISQWKNFSLRIFWGFCDGKEVFHHFFGPQPMEELTSIPAGNLALKIINEAPCFNRFARTGDESDCKCPEAYMVHSGKFYNSLVQRFRERSIVEAFRTQHAFDRHTVIGIHIRAGNGETGDFVSKKRGIQNTTQWIQSISETFLEISRYSEPNYPPLLFVATDTISIVSDIRAVLDGKITVIDYEQERVAEGSGVVFGEAGLNKRKPKSQECFVHWKNSLVDMMILASADIIVAARPSSFTQSLPMGVALARADEDRKTSKSYCEVSQDGDAYQCFTDFHDWCCHGSTSFHLAGIRGYEYRRMPIVDFDGECKVDHHLHDRPKNEKTALVSEIHQQKTYFLPYDWDWVDK